MPIDAPLTLGIEEEYQIIDPDTRELSAFVQQLIDKGADQLGDQVKKEFMQSQIEVGSRVCNNIKEAKVEVIRLRRAISDLAAEHGRVIAAASTHPFSRWQDQMINEGDRYDEIIECYAGCSAPVADFWNACACGYWHGQ